MTLVDTSVWIDHLRSGNGTLGDLLGGALVLMHPFVLGEIACGNLRDRSRIIADLRTLPVATAVDDDDVLQLIDRRKLWGKGIGWTDGHLLASALVTGCRLWTLDRSLSRVAASLGVKATPP